MLISVVLPVYNEEGNLRILFNRLSEVSAQMTDYDFEFIFIDDCSSDTTPALLELLRSEDARVQVLRFARNFGSHAAIEAGLKYCRGNAAIVMATDLQDPPEIIPRLIEQWNKGFKVVWGDREERKAASLATIMFSRLYYILMNLLSNVKYPGTGADIFLIDRIVINPLSEIAEKNSEIFLLISWLGFSQTHINYIKDERYSGVSKWNLSKKFKLFFDSLISFSYIPLRFMSCIGAIISFGGLCYGLYIFFMRLRGIIDISGWPALMITILLIGGFQLSMMGLLGEYLWRTYDETRKRPKFVIEKNTIAEKNANS